MSGHLVPVTLVEEFIYLVVLRDTSIKHIIKMRQ